MAIAEVDFVIVHVILAWFGGVVNHSFVRAGTMPS